MTTTVTKASATPPDQPSWAPDSLLDGYEQLTLPLPNAKRAAGEPDDIELTGTLVRRNPSTTKRAVLYVHGWSDYFFQTHLADFFADQGVDFYAVDLRRYGRNLRTGLLAGYIEDLGDYCEELDAAVEVISADHESITLMGHSTGGLIAVLWADQRPGAVDSVILNSPWLELQAYSMLRSLTQPFLASISSWAPTRALPLSDNGFYLRSIHDSGDGEWSYDLNLKGDPAFAVRVGWMSAVLAGHARVARGLSIDAPILVMTSSRSDFRRKWDDALKSSDIVLDVNNIAKRAAVLGEVVTLVRVKDGIHDLVLSAPHVRARVFDEMRRWMRGYVPD